MTWRSCTWVGSWRPARAAGLFSRPHHPYTVALMSAIPVPDPDVEAGRSRIILQGDIPSSSAAIEGCRFASRCWLRTQLGDPERCTAEEPALRSVEAGHLVACHFPEEMAPGQGDQP